MDHTSFDSGASPIYSDQDHRSDESQSVIDPGGSQSVIDPGGSQSVIDLGGTSMEGNEEVIPSENANDANDERALTLTGEEADMMSNSEAQAGGLGNGGSTQRDRASDESQMVLDPSGFSLGVDGEVIEHENGNEADICAVEDVEPYEGMEFDSEDAAYKFYNAYARLVGFGTRRAKTRRSRTNSEIIGRDFYCWREGRRDAKHDNKRRHRAQLRVGCMAMLRVKRAETGKWVISKFVKDHCHKFLAPDKIGLIRSHRRISDDAKKLLALYASAMSKRPQLMSKEQAGGSGSTQENEDEDEEPVQEGEPYVGMEFDTEYAAYKFYTDYARHVGFGTRWAKTRRSRANKEVIARDIYCFRQGKRKPKRDANVRDGKVRQRPHSRIGCKAMIRIKKSNNGKWVISSFVKKHCHKFLTPGEVGFTRMRKRIFDPSGDLIDLYNEERAAGSQAPRTIRHDVLCQLVNQITEDGAISEDLYEFTRLCLSRLAVEVAERKKLVTNNQPVSSNQASLSLDAGFQAMEIEPQSLTREPSRSNSRGRPPKNNTKCNVCKGTGHNRRTCPIVRGGGSNLNIGIGMVGTEINLDENQISQICTGDEMPAVQILSWGQI
ncbi:hypothetical protein AMTR_s00023p00015970 [Amborella trichopoda]|uniref:FAR1 domain-containing protein n=1 Tax=Amborella trichopoda TaxID=13333 RepID=W1NIB8_AMBTC|nr:hypothetical protein AMTR_s00023p00015970 [Amborella trichopoda]